MSNVVTFPCRSALIAAILPMAAAAHTVGHAANDAGSERPVLPPSSGADAALVSLCAQFSQVDLAYRRYLDPEAESEEAESTPDLWEAAVAEVAAWPARTPADLQAKAAVLHQVMETELRSWGTGSLDLSAYPDMRLALALCSDVVRLV